MEWRDEEVQAADRPYTSWKVDLREKRGTKRELKETIFILKSMSNAITYSQR